MGIRYHAKVSMDRQGYPHHPQRLSATASWFWSKSERSPVQLSSPTLKPCPGVPPFPVSRNINPAFLISQIARSEHVTSTLEAHWCLDQMLSARILASVIFVLSVFIEASLSVCLSQLLIPGASSFLKLRLQPGADPHPQLLSSCRADGPPAAKVASLSIPVGTHRTTVTLRPFDGTIFSSVVVQMKHVPEWPSGFIKTQH